jgi:hypothetical protein
MKDLHNYLNEINIPFKNLKEGKYKCWLNGKFIGTWELVDDENIGRSFQRHKKVRCD